MIYMDYDAASKVFDDRRESLKEELLLIADNDDIGAYIYLTNDNDKYKFIVLDDIDDEYESFETDDAGEFEMKLKNAYIEYIIPIEDCSEEQDEPEGMSVAEQEDEVYVRKDELLCALEDFIRVAAKDSDEHIATTYLTDILNILLRKLSEKFRIFRPIFLLNDDGQCVYTEYPYDEYKFEDSEILEEYAPLE